MCIVIDTNAFHHVFKEDSRDFDQFKPLNRWIRKGKGFVVYGGKTYKDELKQTLTYFLGVFAELRKARKVIEINEQLVNKEERLVKKMEPDPKFDDAHIVAIFRVSRCRLLCSLDSSSDRFIKDKSLYHINQKPPAIYRSRQHAKKLLTNQNIVLIHNKI